MENAITLELNVGDDREVDRDGEDGCDDDGYLVEENKKKAGDIANNTEGISPNEMIAMIHELDEANTNLLGLDEELKSFTVKKKIKKPTAVDLHDVFISSISMCYKSYVPNIKHTPAKYWYGTTIDNNIIYLKLREGSEGIFYILKNIMF